MTMKIEKFEDYFDSAYIRESAKGYARDAFRHQQAKIDDILEYISHIGHQKELDHWLKENKCTD